MRFTPSTALIVVLTGFASIGASYAVCQNARIISTVFPTGSYSYIYSPGVEASEASSSVTGDFEASFWAMGAGHPSIQQGVDSGAFVAMGPERDGWVKHPAGAPTYFHTTWAAGRTIDGCIDTENIKTACTAVLLSDQHNGRGYFAMLSAKPVRGNYSFAQPENAPITLAPIPNPVLVDTVKTFSDVRATVRVDALSAGLFLDAGCTPDSVRGYRIYAQVVEQGGDAPTDRSRPTSGSSGDWVLEAGGEGDGDSVVALASAAQVTIACAPGDDVYLATSLVFDSGFETRYVSESSAPIRCTD